MSHGYAIRQKNYFSLHLVTFLVRRRHLLVLVETRFLKMQAFWSRADWASMGHCLLMIRSLQSGYPNVIARYEELSFKLSSFYLHF